MERPSKFVHSIMVLLLVIEVTLAACTCKTLTLEQAMCESKTVIIARVISAVGLLDEEGFVTSEESDAARTRYKLMVQKVYHDKGPIKLSLNNDYNYMAFPRKPDNCGGILREDVDYLIAGYVDGTGDVYSSMCHHIVEYKYLLGDTHRANILHGGFDCTNP